MKNNNLGLSVILLTLAALLTAPPATAQQFGFVQPSFFGDIALSHSGGRYPSSDDDDEDAPSAQGWSEPQAPSESTAQLTIRRLESSSLESLHMELATAMAPDESTRAPLLQALRSGEMAAQFDEILRYNQMDPTDLANALTAYTVVMWLIVNEQLDGPTDPTAIHAAREQFSPLFRADPALQQLDPGQRAAEFERLASFSVLGIAAYMHHRNENDRESLRQLQDAINEGMRSSGGLDLRTLELTSTGLRPRG
ncbi:MAG: DUF6683 family protein [Halomonadaceae bacterium]|jgi:hypothetical protein